MAIRLFKLQAYPTTVVTSEFNDNQLESTSEFRYLIYDTNCNELLQSSTEYVVVFNVRPFSLNSYKKSIESLIALNYIMKEEIKDFNFQCVIEGSGKSYYKISEEAYNKINKLKSIKGIYTYKKTTKKNSYYWNIVNYLGTIELDKEYKKGSLQEVIKQTILYNKIPKREFELNKDSIYEDRDIINTDNNKNIKLTLDYRLQDSIDNVINSGKFNSLDNIGVILMESKTGKIRALTEKKESEANICIGAGGIGYEPGSIFKLITLIPALEDGLITMNDVYYCNGSVCNDKNVHGYINVTEALIKSCNDTFSKIGQKVGYDELMRYCGELNLFDKVLNLEDEVEGVKPKEEVGLSNISIGQCLTVTPVQMLGAVNSIVNNGEYVKPYIIDGILDNEGNIIEEFNTYKKQVFSKITSLQIKRAMEDVVEKGTGQYAQVEGVTIGGKTGSATSGKGNSTHGWFIGYFELNNIEYTMIVFVPDMIDTDEGIELGGGNTAAPIFSQIVKSLIN
ncbi:penicillin-binding protein 2 [Clostridium sp. MSJ-8]|uniref:peptidoglycan D,D-transpeptidase FtsI family protein n=1 Tax=Clostridium sp. MSJ-8 TaxID=2841510 RepID=UPI00209FC893|nr:penicillin-binding transpeptidase domain-containing protein [Clostridium sp. MSJ-8]